mmetsp:Transcript_21630/g.33061  ORF Transcript_21630/g.33061 Transcript_21630/m.33061 type:complete len:289 (+) Transcript_21630:209-1075(+)|eukprot:CAMPEP_0177721124 /NCGR_PEP_ID=MMETSP0484_2-20121128/16978_1 /TAXON_ID=354590 /ORGANISM="Rhodomonas lens, Strain RHODO" /LENGTH=288 /DNA_ID=CAMNT_0019233405 /DNA_START=280 /DNA_END=1146 /DNA_ORIENTATION=-
MSTFIRAVTFFPRLIISVPSYAVNAALGSGKKAEPCIEEGHSAHCKDVGVEDQEARRPAQALAEEQTSDPHAMDLDAEEEKSNPRADSSESYMFSWLYRRWSPLKERTLESLQDDIGFGEEILDRYLTDQIRLLEEEGADTCAEEPSNHGIQNVRDDDHLEVASSLDCTYRDSVSSSAGVFEAHSGDLEEMLFELYELRASQQQYDEAWWEYGLNLCSASIPVQPLPLFGFSVRPPLFSTQFRFELTHGTVDSTWIRLWNFGLNLNMVHPKQPAAAQQKKALCNDEEC